MQKARFFTTGSIRSARETRLVPVTRKERIEASLDEGLSPVHLEVADESHRHSAGAGAETHYNVTVVSDAFAGERRVARHRRIHALLQPEFDGGLHALTLTLLTPAEWEERGEAIASPGCRGGSKADKTA